MRCVRDRALAAAVTEPAAIRLALASDAAALAAIDAGSQIHPWSEAQFAALVSGVGNGAETALVADRNGEVVGYVAFTQVLDEASVLRIAVREHLRGRGFGQALLQAAVERMRRTGASRCLLEVRASNSDARRLYEANGFALDGVRKNYYPAPSGREDALLMSRSL